MTPLFSRYLPDQISSYDAIELGTGGFCFLVAELLKELYPKAELRRLTNLERNRYYHVFVRLDGQACDIKGFRSVEEMRSDLNETNMVEESVDAQAIQDYFYPCFSPEQLAAARAVLRKAIFR